MQKDGIKSSAKRIAHAVTCDAKGNGWLGLQNLEYCQDAGALL